MLWCLHNACTELQAASKCQCECGVSHNRAALMMIKRALPRETSNLDQPQNNKIESQAGGRACSRRSVSAMSRARASCLVWQRSCSARASARSACLAATSASSACASAEHPACKPARRNPAHAFAFSSAGQAMLNLPEVADDHGLQQLQGESTLQDSTSTRLAL